MTLPHDEDGHVNTSAEFGEGYVVEIHYNTDFDGRQIDPGKEEHPRTLHGDFKDLEEAMAWMEGYPDGDTDIYDMTAIVMNRVRP